LLTSSRSLMQNNRQESVLEQDFLDILSKFGKICYMKYGSYPQVMRITAPDAIRFVHRKAVAS
jgi:RNA recognition motif-containing protein